MGLDFDLNPDTLDLQLDGAGWFKMNATASAAVIYQYTHDYDAWPIDPTAGSRLRELATLGADDITLEAMRIEILRAGGVLVDDDLIANVEASARETKPGGFDFETSYRDQSTGDRLDAPVEPFGGGG